MQNLYSENFVNKAEAESLRELIYNRSRAKAESMQKSIQNDFADTMKAEIMNSARESFKSKNNPFSIESNNVQIERESKNYDTKYSNTQSFQEDKSARSIKNLSSRDDKNIKEQKIRNEIENNMLIARKSLSNKKNFLGALEFLNAQATISLVEKKQGYFSAIA